MKGYLHKTEEGWFVIYDQRTMQDPSAEDGMIPLHPNDVATSSFSFYNGKEVDFEIIQYDGTIPILNAWNGYAKLIDHIVNTNEMVNKLSEEHKKRVQKLIDKDIFDQATLAMEEHYGSGCETEIDAYFRGAKWMQQELNK